MTPFTWQVDLNASFKLLETENQGSLTATIDVFNLFDSDGVTRVVEQGMIRNDRRGPLLTDYTALAPYFGDARSRQAPRSVRVGLRYVF